MERREIVWAYVMVMQPKITVVRVISIHLMTVYEMTVMNGEVTIQVVMMVAVRK